MKHGYELKKRLGFLHLKANIDIKINKFKHQLLKSYVAESEYRLQQMGDGSFFCPLLLKKKKPF